MTQGIRLGGQLPAGDRNGLVRITSQLIDDPHAAHVAVVVLDCKQLTVNTDDETQTPLVRIRAIEPLTTAEDIAAVSAALRRAFEQRTGKVELPFEMTQDAERVTLADRPDLPDAGSLTDDGDAIGGDLPEIPPAADLDAPAEWEDGYPEGKPDAEPTEEEPGNVRAFRSPFQTSGQ